jgi:hypothetical protein
MRVEGDRLARNEMYRKMYPNIYSESVNSSERQDFLIGRTIRTSAQYLSLGRLVAEKIGGCFPVIICHPTKNISYFNDRNKFLLAEDGLQPQPTIPIFEMKRKVY